MTFQEFQEEAKRTCPSLGDVKLDLCHMTLGLVSELEEYMLAMVGEDIVNAREELADMCWYLANYCTFRGYDFEEVVGNIDILSFELKDDESNTPTMSLFISRLSDYVKKYVAYGKPMDESLERKAIEAIAYSMTLDDNYFNPSVDLQNNINKLKQRYPEKFTTENAINRDVNAERKILENI